MDAADVRDFSNPPPRKNYDGLPPTLRGDLRSILFFFYDEPLLYSSECEVFVYKYLEWCGTDRYVILTLFCLLDRRDSTSVENSRVVLVDLQDPTSPQYFDLSAALADYLGIPSVDSITVQSVYSTCSRRVSSIQLPPYPRGV